MVPCKTPTHPGPWRNDEKVQNKASMMDNLLPPCGLSGCDTVAKMKNIRKEAILNVMEEV